MPSSLRWLPLVVVLAGAAFVSSCAVGSSTTTRTVDDFDQEISVGTSYSVHGSDADAWLEQGREHARSARFTEATSLFQRVYDAQAATPDQRATALLELARLQLNVLNPSGSEDTARDYFDQLIREFPDSEQAQEAEDRLGALAPSE